jgi:AcrR family transcriptional regulator
MVRTSPERPAKRSLRREATLERIVDAALVVVTEEGVEALTMQRLAQELGYAIGALYRYFPSKDALLLAVQRRVLDHLADDLTAADARAVAHLDRSQASAQAAVLTRLVLAARVYETLPDRRPSHFRLLSVWLGDPAPIVQVESALPAVPASVALFLSVPALLREAVERGALVEGDATERTLVLFGAVHGVLTLRKLSRYGIAALEPSMLSAELVRALLRGWGATEPHLTDAMRRARRLSPSAEEGT